MRLTANASAAVAGFGFVFAIAIASAVPEAGAEARRPSGMALIAAAKKAPLAPFMASEDIRGLTVEAWMKKLFPGRAVVWRSATCRAKAGDAVMVNSPICVEALVRFEKGVVFTLGVGFDDTAAKPQEKPNALWGTIAIRGKHCDFYRHPDQVQRSPKAIAGIVKSGRCQ